MKKSSFKWICILFLTGSFSRAIGQTTIRGKVENEDRQPVEFVTVTLLNFADSSLVKGGITDSAGAFSFSEVPSGEYRVAASMIGMIKTFSAPFQSKNTNELPPLRLKPNSKILKGVQITASRPFIEHKPGETIVNVENSTVSEGSSALEVLKKSPGVSVDNNDNISLRGQQGVNVLINGKATHLSSEQLAEMLKAMPASSISKIELMTHPSSNYDAEGSAGIINIKLKKNVNEGFNGSLKAGWGQAVYPQAETGINLNYKKEKWSFFGGYHLGRHSQIQWLNLYRQYLGKNNQSSDSMAQHSILKKPSFNQQFNFGADYDIDKKNSIGLMANGAFSRRRLSGNNHTFIYNSEGRLISTSASELPETDKWKNLTYNLHFKHTFDTSGTEITANLDYSQFTERDVPHFNNFFYGANGNSATETEYKKGNIFSNIQVKSGKIDFSHPFNKDTKLSAGVKTSLVVSDNDVIYRNLKGDDWAIDSGRTNHFIYKENVNAAYVSFSREMGKGWSGKAGLRAEQTIAKGNQIITNENFSRNYLQLFPTLFIQKNINKDNQVELAYSRRINRPDYQELNPFRYYIDPYTYGKGNPDLTPELTRSVELTYLFKHILIMSFNYSHTRDVINETLNMDKDEVNRHQVVYDTRDNLGSLNRLSASFTATLPITGWWNTNTTISPMYGHYYGKYQDTYLDNAQFTLFLHSTNSFILPAGMKAELSGQYHSPMAYGVLHLASQSRIDAGISKTFLEDQLNLKLNVSDIFHTGGARAESNYPDMNMKIRNSFSSRRVNLTLSWNFGNRKLKLSHHKDTGIEEEQNRIKK